MSKLLKSMLSIAMLSSSVFAFADGADIELKVGGEFDFRAGTRKQSLKNAATNKATNVLNQTLYKSLQNMTPHQKKIALESTADIMMNLSASVSEDFSYGAILHLNGSTYQRTSHSAVTDGSHIFVETPYGKIEAGSQNDAANKMVITALNLGRGSVDGWKYFADLDRLFAGRNVFFKSAPDFYLSNMTQRNTEASRKVSYFTPSMMGFQFGLSFIPDTTNIGYGSYSSSNTNSYILPTGRVGDIKNAISWGAGYDYNLCDGMDIQLAATGEFGSAPKNANAVKLENLRTYNLGGALFYGNASFAASYGSLGKSLTAKSEQYRKTNYYTLGAAYEFDSIGVALVHFHSDHKKNKLNTYGLTTDYKVAPGLLPYMEVTHFRAKGSDKYSKTDGFVVILGTKLQF